MAHTRKEIRKAENTPDPVFKNPSPAPAKNTGPTQQTSSR